MRYAKAIACVGILSFVGCESVTREPGPPPEAPWTVIYSTLDAYEGPMSGILAGQCLRAPLPTDTEGQIRCVVVSATTDSAGPSHCTAAGRVPIPASDASALKAVKADTYWLNTFATQTGHQANNFCELTQLSGPASDSTSARYRCENSADPNPDVPDGWCYVDPASDPPFGNHQVVETADLISNA